MNGVPSILALLGDFNGCAAWRVAWPFKYLQRQGFNARYLQMSHARVAEAAAAFDIVLFQRLTWTDTDGGRDAIAGIRRAGKVALLEVDDDMWVSRPEQKSHAELGIQEEEASPAQNRESIQLFDGVIVSTERLRTVIHSFAPSLPVEVVPNAIDLDYWTRELAGWTGAGKDGRNLEGKTTIGWFGGDRYDRDVLPLAEAWTRIAEKHPRVQFVLQGHQPEPLVRAVPPERLHHTRWLPLQAENGLPFYGVGLSEIDIGCAIVAPTLFNAAKTPIKLWEYTVAGAAVVGSDWLYGPYIDHGKDGYRAGTVDEWVLYLDRLIRSPKQRAKFQARHYAKIAERYSLEANAWRHVAAWTKLAEASRRVHLPAGVQHAAV